MSDIKKRVAEDSASNGISNKRILLDTLSEEGPLTQEDVVYFQKELIWRQMRLYKRQWQTVRKQLAQADKELKVEQKKVGHLLLWYREVLNSYTIPEGTTLNDSILSKFEEDELVDQELTLMRENFIKALSAVSSGVSDETVKLNLADLNNEIVKLSNANKILKRNEEDLKGQLKQLENQVTELNKIMERSDSKTLQRISGDVKKEEVEDIKQEPQTDNLIKTEEAVNSEEFDKLNLELLELKELNENMTKQVNEEIAVSSGLRKELASVTLRLSNLSDEDLSRSSQYQALSNENSSLLEEVSDLRLKVKQYFTTVSEYEQERSLFKLQVTNELNKEKLELTKNLERLEQDLIRIRTIRDDLISKNSVLKSDKSYKEVSDELAKLVELQKKRIDELTQERQTQLSESSTSDMDKESLIKQNLLLVNELKDLETAFKEVQELSIKKLLGASETASLINKLNVEKLKADQKYFGTMRVNDALVQENKLAKVTIAKQSELVVSLREMEKKLMVKVESVEAKYKDLKFLENNLVNENQQLRKKSVELTTRVESLMKQNSRLTEVSEKLVSERDLEINLRKQKTGEITKLSSKLKSAETLNAKYRANLSGTIQLEDEEQINALRAMVKCSVCSKNWKDTVIKDCGHVFCSECAQERLAARLRRCPTCNKQFSSNDLVTIHL